MADTSLETQTAVYDALRASANLIAILADGVDGVVDTVEQGQAFPYVNIMPFDSTTEETKNQDGQVHSFQIDCWSRIAGQEQVRNMVAAVRDALHRANLTIPSGDVIFSRVTNTRVFLDNDKKTLHGIVENEIKILSD